MQRSDVAVLLVVGALLWHRVLHRRQVRSLVRSLGPLPSEQRDAVMCLARACFQLPNQRHDDLAYLRAWR